MKKLTIFYFLGEKLKGEVFVDIDGKQKIKDEKGYIYVIGNNFGQANLEK